VVGALCTLDVSLKALRQEQSRQAGDSNASKPGKSL